jgi:competence protein ComEA
VLVTGALSALGLLWWLARPDASAGQAQPALVVEQLEVVVHVAGRVAAPGVYHLPGGARVADALAAAGGPLPGAGVDHLNLARPLSDGEQLVVADPHADPPAAEGDSGGGQATGGGQPPSAWRPDGTLDLNLATTADLEQLPGVGPVTAQRIVDHREHLGRFSSVEDLLGVAGIGDKRFQALAELVSAP